MDIADLWAYPFGGRFIVHFISAPAKLWFCHNMVFRHMDPDEPVSLDPDEYDELYDDVLRVGLYIITDTGMEH